MTTAYRRGRWYGDLIDSTASSVLANDTDADPPNDSLTVSAGTGPTFASAFTLNTDGTFSYTHDGSENFTDSFTYVVSDANGGVTDTDRLDLDNPASMTMIRLPMTTALPSPRWHRHGT
ncbi:MAG: Ig-like domain-containing protein [Burkholderiaceae bacterium]